MRRPTSLTEDLGGRLRALAAAGRSLSGVDDEDELYDLAVAAALTVLHADSVTLARFDRAEGTAEVLRNHGQLAEWEEPRPALERYPVSTFPHLGTLLFEGSSWSGTLGIDAFSPAEQELLASIGKQHVLLVPVLIGGHSHGGLYGLRAPTSPPFEELDLQLAEGLTSLVAASLRHLQDRASLRELAYRDRLTGLANRRAVDERLEELFEGEVAVPIGVLLGDVNALKPVNDLLGHAEGDRLLCLVASLLTQEVANFPTGLAGRLGGDEFCLVLPGVDEHDLAALAGRLERAAAELPTGDGLSCGWALTEGRLAGVSTTAEATRGLLRLADAMQYRRKREYRAIRDGRVARETGATLPAAPPQPSFDEERTVGRALTDAAMEIASSDAGVEARLEALAAVVSRALEAASWWVSRSDGIDLVVVAGEYLRYDGTRPAVQVPVHTGERLVLADFPASAQALDDQAFFGSLDHGDLRERDFLAAFGYLAVLGAGATRAGTGWLVEVYADAASAPFAPHEGLLLALVQLVVGCAAEA